MKVMVTPEGYELYKENILIGWCKMEDCHIEALWLEPRWRGKGYGSYLLKEVLRATGGYDRALPSCHTAPVPVTEGERAFWEKFGFLRREGQLVRRRKPDLSAVELTHRMVAQLCPAPALAIDATCGNGHDTAFLCSIAQRVIGLDIQPQAVENTRRRLAAGGYTNGVVLLENHTHLDRLAAPGSVDCILFNLGWLPGTDHQIYSQAATSLEAVEKALGLLVPGGVLGLVLYSGRVIGSEEKDAMLAWLERLPLTQYTVLVCRYANYDDTAPLPCFVIKK